MNSINYDYKLISKIDQNPQILQYVEISTVKILFSWVKRPVLKKLVKQLNKNIIVIPVSMLLVSFLFYKSFSKLQDLNKYLGLSGLDVDGEFYSFSQLQLITKILSDHYDPIFLKLSKENNQPKLFVKYIHFFTLLLIVYAICLTYDCSKLSSKKKKLDAAIAKQEEENDSIRTIRQEFIARQAVLAQEAQQEAQLTEAQREARREARREALRVQQEALRAQQAARFAQQVAEVDAQQEARRVQWAQQAAQQAVPQL